MDELPVDARILGEKRHSHVGYLRGMSTGLIDSNSILVRRTEGVFGVSCIRVCSST